MPLSLAPHGRLNTIVKITGKDETRRLLQSMGLVIGTPVTIISELNGNVILGVKDTRVALDKALAQRIIV